MLLLLGAFHPLIEPLATDQFPAAHRDMRQAREDAVNFYTEQKMINEPLFLIPL